MPVVWVKNLSKTLRLRFLPGAFRRQEPPFKAFCWTTRSRYPVLLCSQCFGTGRPRSQRTNAYCILCTSLPYADTVRYSHIILPRLDCNWNHSEFPLLISPKFWVSLPHFLAEAVSWHPHRGAQGKDLRHDSHDTEIAWVVFVATLLGGKYYEVGQKLMSVETNRLAAGWKESNIMCSVYIYIYINIPALSFR